MEAKDKANNKTEHEPIENYNPKDRDFQRTENDIDDISKSEKEELEERKKRTHFASSKPDKNHVG